MAIGVVSPELWNFSGECLSSTGLNKLLEQRPKREDRRPEGRQDSRTAGQQGGRAAARQDCRKEGSLTNHLTLG